MQSRIAREMLSRRVREGKRWQDHQRLQFEVIHNKDTTLLKSLLMIYRERIKEQPTLLLRWAYANCTFEIVENGICYLSEYALEKGDYLAEEEVIELCKQLIQEAPKQVVGYLGLARAYKAGFSDPELVRYYKIISQGETTIKVNGRTERVRKIVAINPERIHRYRLLREKVREMEPENPFIYYWDADSLSAEHVRDHKAIDFTKGLELSLKAYHFGMSHVSPIICLGLIVWFAWKAGRREDMDRYSEELRRWAAQAPRSAYVEQVRNRMPDCPAIKKLSL